MSTNIRGVLSLAIAGVFALVTACGSGGSSTTASSETTTSSSSESFAGSAVKGPIANATVNAYAVNSDGSRGQLLGTTTTDAHGDYTLNFSHSGAVEVVITGGTYTDEATGATVDFTGKEMTAVVTGVTSGDTVIVTPISAAAATAAKGRMAAGEDPSTAVGNANTQVAAVFGISPSDITSVKPSDYNNGESGSAAANAYAVAIAALSQMVANNGGDPADVIDLALGVGQDLVDGVAGGDALTVANGLGAAAAQLPSNPTTQGVAITPTVPTDISLPGAGDSAVGGSCKVGAPVLIQQTDTTLQLGAGAVWSGNPFEKRIVEMYSNAAATVLIAPIYGGMYTGLTKLTTYFARTTANCYNGTTGQWEVVSSPLTPYATKQDMTPPVIDPLFPWMFNDIAGLDANGMLQRQGIWFGTATLNEAATGYCVAQLAGTAAPTPLQVRNATAPGQVVTGNAPFPALLPGDCPLHGLTDGVSYDMYFVAEDLFGNLQTTVSAVLAFIPDSTPPAGSFSAVVQANTPVGSNTFTFTATASLGGGTGQICGVPSGSPPPTMVACEAVLALVTPVWVVAANVPFTTPPVVELAAAPQDYYFMAESLVNNHALLGPLNVTTPGPVVAP